MRTYWNTSRNPSGDASLWLCLGLQSVRHPVEFDVIRIGANTSSEKAQTARRHCTISSQTLQTRVWPFPYTQTTSELFSENILQGSNFKGLLSKQTLEFVILDFKLAHPLKLRDRYTCILGFLLVVGWLADAVFPANFHNYNFKFTFLQNCNNLAFRKPWFPYFALLSYAGNSKVSYVRYQGKLTGLPWIMTQDKNYK